MRNTRLDHAIDTYALWIQSHQARKRVAGAIFALAFFTIALLAYIMTGLSVGIVFFMVIVVAYAFGEEVYDQ